LLAIVKVKYRLPRKGPSDLAAAVESIYAALYSGMDGSKEVASGAGQPQF
jgi:hypothetical protein